MENFVAVIDDNETSDLSVVEKKWLSDKENQKMIITKLLLVKQ